jgi:hypothetical protein
MNRTSPADRDRAQRRVRVITMATAVGAGVLTLGGAAAAAGTFGGRAVSAAQTPRTAPTPDPGTGLQPPTQPPADGSGVSGSGTVPPITSGGS